MGISLLFIFGFTQAYAQSPSQPLVKVSRQIGRAVVNECLDHQKCNSFPGEALSLAVLDPAQTCSVKASSDDPIIDDGSERKREILFISEISVSPSEQSNTGDWRLLQSQSDLETMKKAVTATERSDWGQLGKWSEQYKTDDIRSRMGAYVEGLVTVASESSLSEKELAGKMAQAISSYTDDRDEKLRLLSMMSDRLYKAYNDNRNPWSNTTGVEDKRNMQLGDLLKAASNWSKADGGVCNDIAQSMSVLAKEVFPNDTVLVYNNGTHFGYLVKEKGKDPVTTIWGWQTDSRKELKMDPAMQVTATRLYQVDSSGKMSQIASLDNELGTVFKKMYSETSPVIQTGNTPSVAYVQMGRQFTKSNGAKKTLALKGGLAKTSDSVMVVVIGESTRQKGRWSSSTAVGAGYQYVTKNDQQEPVIALHKTLDYKWVRFVSPKVKLGISSGAQADLTYVHPLNLQRWEFYSISYFSRTFELNHKVNFETVPQSKNSATLKANLVAGTVFGRGNEGVQTGLDSEPSLSGTLKSLKHTNLFVNQIDGKGALTIPLKTRLNLQTEAHYQGTPVGQRISLDTGLSVQSSGMFDKVYMLVGVVKSDLPGFKINDSLLGGDPSGGRVQVGAKLKKGTQGSLKYQGIGSVRPMGTLEIDVPIFRR